MQLEGKAIEDDYWGIRRFGAVLGKKAKLLS